MSDWIDITEPVRLHKRRCYTCGIFWAYETRRGEGRCPVCANDEFEKLYATLHQAKRSVAALRGALTKARIRK